MIQVAGVGWGGGFRTRRAVSRFRFFGTEGGHPGPDSSPSVLAPAMTPGAGRSVVAASFVERPGCLSPSTIPPPGSSSVGSTMSPGWRLDPRTTVGEGRHVAISPTRSLALERSRESIDDRTGEEEGVGWLVAVGWRGGADSSRCMGRNSGTAKSSRMRVGSEDAVHLLSEEPSDRLNAAQGACRPLRATSGGWTGNGSPDRTGRSLETCGRPDEHLPVQVHDVNFQISCEAVLHPG
jgi:hypothetical protein